MEIVYDESTGTWGEYEGPYTTLGVQTEEDWNKLEFMINNFSKLEEENSELKRLLRESMSTMKVIADTYREETVNDGICGFCEFDGPIQGDWYPECPGFERDDCFKWKHAEEALKLIGDEDNV